MKHNQILTISRITLAVGIWAGSAWGAVEPSSYSRVDAESLVKSPQSAWARSILFTDEIVSLPDGRAQRLDRRNYYPMQLKAAGQAWIPSDLAPQFQNLDVGGTYSFGGTVDQISRRYYLIIDSCYAIQTAANMQEHWIDMLHPEESDLTQQAGLSDSAVQGMLVQAQNVLIQMAQANGMSVAQLIEAQTDGGQRMAESIVADALQGQLRSQNKTAEEVMIESVLALLQKQAVLDESARVGKEESSAQWVEAEPSVPVEVLPVEAFPETDEAEIPVLQNQNEEGVIPDDWMLALAEWAGDDIPAGETTLPEAEIDVPPSGGASVEAEVMEIAVPSPDGNVEWTVAEASLQDGVETVSFEEGGVPEAERSSALETWPVPENLETMEWEDVLISPPMSDASGEQGGDALPADILEVEVAAAEESGLSQPAEWLHAEMQDEMPVASAEGEGMGSVERVEDETWSIYAFEEEPLIPPPPASASLHVAPLSDVPVAIRPMVSVAPTKVELELTKQQQAELAKQQKVAARQAAKEEAARRKEAKREARRIAQAEKQALADARAAEAAAKKAEKALAKEEAAARKTAEEEAQRELALLEAAARREMEMSAQQVAEEEARALAAMQEVEVVQAQMQSMLGQQAETNQKIAELQARRKAAEAAAQLAEAQRQAAWLRAQEDAHVQKQARAAEIEAALLREQAAQQEALQMAAAVSAHERAAAEETAARLEAGLAAQAEAEEELRRLQQEVDVLESQAATSSVALPAAVTAGTVEIGATGTDEAPQQATAQKAEWMAKRQAAALEKEALKAQKKAAAEARAKEKAEAAARRAEERRQRAAQKNLPAAAQIEGMEEGELPEWMQPVRF
ncbi:MAG: hypothetical protein LBN38_07655 [Verrucomicrobiota bacterium]|jgi:hypothetical protein|nr:hypothetical protein [Verrucomicrobiota bacterium]